MSIVVTFGEEYRGVRLDVALTEVLADKHAPFAGASRSQVQQLIAAGGVTLGSAVPKKNRLLSGGERVLVSLDVWAELARDRAQLMFQPHEFPYSIPVLYEDGSLLVIDKPAGVMVHPVPGQNEPTVVDYLKAHSFTLAETSDALKPGIVHRLDRGTSGLLLVAKDPRTHSRLQEALERRQVAKYYLALTLGGPLPEQARWEFHLARHPRHRELFTVAPQGRYSLTYCRVLAQNPLCAFLLLRIVTGRTHQIRVHLKQQGHVVIGDTEYGRGPTNELRRFLGGSGDRTLRRAWSEAVPDAAFRERLGAALAACPGMFLHAYSLSLAHPVTGETLTLRAEPPQYFADWLSRFSWRAPEPPTGLQPVEAKL